ncbi:HK97 gp10 family phage protein [Mesorhizobium sp. J428]|uniref:HK97 gp10 family phage protein n=1 Tax=Mesorhizobium sp. J428 TaxID=2898440 RepID=UPI0021515D68|nr:HK97 gp10 family phage protein [Mesorhizobium sp. J428]MCR5856574.1 HK97 gp10 family phage protein [Mesorhizobium sp. J428]
MADDGGIGRLTKRLNNLPNVVKAAVRPTLLKQANEMASTMRQLVAVDSGDLRDSIEITGPDQSTPPYSQPGGSMVVPALSAAVTAGNEDVRYAHLVEYGHKASGFSSHDVPAQPFFWPAVRLHNKKARKAIKAAVGRAVRKNWGKGS